VTLAASSVRTLAWISAACFVAAWFLPAAADVPGWAAFRYALSPLWPYHTAEARAVEDAAPQVLSALTNVAFVVMFALLVAGKVRRPGLFLRVGVACFALNLYWLVEVARHGSMRDLWIGYYAWQAAFALLAFIGWRLVRTSPRPPA